MSVRPRRLPPAPKRYCVTCNVAPTCGWARRHTCHGPATALSKAQPEQVLISLKFWGALGKVNCPAPHTCFREALPDAPLFDDLRNALPHSAPRRHSRWSWLRDHRRREFFRFIVACFLSSTAVISLPFLVVDMLGALRNPPSR